MDTEVIKIDAEAQRADAIRRGTEVLSHGGLVAFRTETVYGLGVRADDDDAVARLRTLKQRPEGKGFTVQVSAAAAVHRFAPDLNGLAARLISRAWPGPLTLVVPVADPASTPVMAELGRSAASALFVEGTVGLRCPDDAVTREILSACPAPVVAASANLAGEAPPSSGDAVLKALDGRFDLLIDAGPTRYAKPSTIVRVADGAYHILREGVLDDRILRRFSTLRILLVCTGNTCRSAMAAVLAEKMIADRVGCDVADLSDRKIEIFSAGTFGGAGGASPHAVQVMAQRGLDLSNHQSAALTAEMVRQADHVFCMTRAHCDAVSSMVPAAKDRVQRLVDHADVDDPVGGDRQTYERCAQTIEAGLRDRLSRIIP
ncbi:MAG: L-threonylcarbamoyladenylate synthase [Phycisphaerae bacterium]